MTTETRAADPDPAPPLSEDRQALVGYRTNEEWIDLLDEAQVKIDALDAVEPAETRDHVFSLLQTVDAIHREALHRLVRLFKEGVVDQVITDPAIHTLLGMYDLLPNKQPGCEKAWDFLGDGVSGPAPRHQDRSTPSPDLPHWSPALIAAPPSEGQALICNMEKTVIVSRVNGELFAVDPICETHGGAAVAGQLSGYSWICPLGPGCVYDVRSGARLGGGPGLTCFPLKTDAGGRLLVGFGVPFKPNLPAL